MKDLLKMIFGKRTPDETAKETEKLIDSLRRLQGNEDFQVIRRAIQCYYADSIKGVSVCPTEAVDYIRGQMSAYERIFVLTGKDGIKQLEAEKEQTQRVIGLGVAESLLSEE